MANRFNFASPGAAAVDELTRLLAERETRRRQDFLDSITSRKMNLDEKQEDRYADQQKRAFEDQQLNRESVRVERMHEDALPDDVISAEDAELYRKHGRGNALRSSGAGIAPEAQLNLPAVDVDVKGDLTPDQMAALDQALTGNIDDLQNNVTQTRQGVAPGVVIHRGGSKYLADRKAAEERAAREREASTAREATARENRLSREATVTAAAENRKAAATLQREATATAAQERRFNGLAAERARSPLMKAADRTIVLRHSADAINQNPNDPSNQLNLAYSWIQALDTYQSAVREGELQLAQGLATKWQNFRTELTKYLPTDMGGQGAVMAPETATMIAKNAEQLIKTIDQGRMMKEREFRARAKVSGVESQWDQFMSEAGIQTQPAAVQQSADPVAPAGARVIMKRDASGRLVRQ